MKAERGTVRKALIPAAGMGTRYLPLSKAVPKELIPVDGLPVLHHVVAEAKAAGCREIGIILSDGKEAIRTYFTPDEALVRWLEEKGKRAVMAEWEALMDGLRFTWIRQAEPRGLGDAVRCGAAFAGDEAVCVLLGDTLMRGGSPLPDMVAAAAESGLAHVAVEAVAPPRATRYGVCGGTRHADGRFVLEHMVEKPSLREVPRMRTEDGRELESAYAFAARYVLTPAVFRELQATPPGLNGEIQLTDAMAAVLARDGFGAVALPGERLDVGTR